nr:hypothetical protein [Parapedobacter indicus]
MCPYSSPQLAQTHLSGTIRHVGHPTPVHVEICRVGNHIIINPGIEIYLYYFGIAVFITIESIAYPLVAIFVIVKDKEITLPSSGYKERPVIF